MSGYKQATSAQVRQVVGRMVDEGLEARSNDLKRLIETVDDYAIVAKRLSEVLSAVERKMHELESRFDDYEKLTRDRFEGMLGRLDKTQAMVATLTERIAGTTQVVSGYGRQAGTLKQQIDQANRRMGHIEEVLLKNREEAINALAQQLGRAIAKHAID